ncbi:MAG TPA: family 16 glycosylhydrolase [Paludibacteraceae bacterium]|nr:family 16 glycosylhydrolase [Paludibacteraceae bacterium]HPH62140.1 family 16 glycosylhydrolase [Paludibacteraceae bacterium]HQF50619.1 family 16 glycosylhydrolase [Paludibacteraceae bacterium]
METKLIVRSLLSLCLLPFIGFSQNSFVLDDFEGDLNSWSAVNDKTHISFEIVDNPSPDGVNSSDHVLKCTRKAGSVSWAGVILRGVYTLNIDSDPSVGYGYASVKFKKESRGNVSFKTESGPDDETYESTLAYPNSSDWVDMTFDLRSAAYGDYSDFFVMVDRAEEIANDEVIYIDDITLFKEDLSNPVLVDPKSQNGTGEKDGYKIVWADLFDDNYLNTSVWNVEVRGDGGGNNELQYYRTQNVQETKDNDGNGCLVITAKKESYSGKNATSGRLTTQGKMGFKYGKLEASIKLPKTANGLWPAFWLLGQDINYNQWPKCGEIDVLEMGNSGAFSSGKQESYFNGACHWGTVSDGGHPSYTQTSTWSYSLQDDKFHLYTMYWDENKIEMFVDQDIYPNARPYYTLSINDKSNDRAAGLYFHHDFFVLFNLAVGADFTGIYDINGITALANSDAKMYVNYVKVYQKEGDNSTYDGPKYVGLEEIDATESGLSGIMSGEIYDFFGNRVVCFENNANDCLQSLNAGVYIVKFEDGSALKVYKK